MNTSKEKQEVPAKVKLVKRQNSAVLPEALDGGWGWMVILGAAVNFTVFGLIVRVFGVFYFELLLRFQANATTTAWVGAINMSLSGLLCEYSVWGITWLSADMFHLAKCRSEKI